MRLLTCQKLATLELQKVRKNEFVEILPINVGCLGACTYCKTKHVRGHLRSYTIDSLIGCVKSMISEGVRALLWKVVYSEHSDPKSLWVATLDPNGAITFYDLNKRRAPNPEAVKVPQDPCGIPQSSDLYCGCFFENWCIYPKLIKSHFNCKPPNISTCSRSSTKFIYVDEELDYFAF